jgi:hypothetical protein
VCHPDVRQQVSVQRSHQRRGREGISRVNNATCVAETSAMCRAQCAGR